MRYIKSNRDLKYEWHKWFAWHPVRFGMYYQMDSGEKKWHEGNLMSWLEIVHRKRIISPIYDELPKYIYAPIFNNLSEGQPCKEVKIK